MKPTDINLDNPYYAYLFGFIQTDGHLYNNTRDRGRLSIEVNKKDEHILWAFKSLLPFNSSITERVRKTNFSNNHTSVIWRVYDKRFRDYLELWGLPNGCKSELIKTPSCSFSKVDYFRGLIDGDGSLGLTCKGFPFLSFVTSSSHIVVEYIELISQITGKVKTSNRNTRDSIYNIVVYKEDAQKLAKHLYYDGCLALSRKLIKANEVLNWSRPANMRCVTNRKFWTPEEDKYITNHPIESSMKVLGRSRNSIELRLWRLNKQSKQSVTN
ncbi:hypothetical protein NIES37_01860 [Tolypothrix tenuis PCC 7101]|uniref:Homing endonuclease LAGLIDADG domain-containing protein n=1 Tax=Tolypothrix tenuis PCC 7101 TaxID=231146 RepID=A0A1Z4MS03_9CYAN|nr:hypothetical protein [Aulosira sp. FACHB-113]BAY96256.1 hypothetical protein NIES37_01860 [Tolypothrix tenuis PCC 7101]BAZ73237.1 hypothetical protein NIES50_17980 [Aulosira laxa NIES-50]